MGKYHAYAYDFDIGTIVGHHILSLDNSFTDSVSFIIIGNQIINLYGGPEARA